jgi:hypothetical protein
MAQDIRLDFSGSTTAITITINSVADAGNATATRVDFGAQAPAQAGIHVVLDGNSASNVDYVEWYMLWSEDDSAYQAAAVALPVHATQMQGTTAFDDLFVIDIKARYGKLYFVNNSGDSMLSSGNSAEWYPIAVDQA